MNTFSLLSVGAAIILGAVACGGDHNAKQDQSPEKKVPKIEQDLKAFAARLSQLEGQLKEHKLETERIKSHLQLLRSLLGPEGEIQRQNAWLRALKTTPTAGLTAEQWMAKVEMRGESELAKTAPSAIQNGVERYGADTVIGVDPTAANCSSSGIRLTIVGIALDRNSTQIEIELEQTKSEASDFAIPPRDEVYLTDGTPSGKYRLGSVDTTHLSRREGRTVIRMNPTERIRTVVVFSRRLRPGPSRFQLYWPECGIVEFFPTSPVPQ